jgi:hypothetical protein
MKCLRSLLIRCQSLPNCFNQKIVTIITICSLGRSEINVGYQNVVNMIVCFPIRRRPNKFMIVTM